MSGERLEAAHKALGRASGRIVWMIVKRRVRTGWLVESVEDLEFATQELRSLLAELGFERNHSQSAPTQGRPD